MVINLIAVKLQWRFVAKEAGKPGANTAGDTMLLLRKGPPGGGDGVGSFSEDVIRVFTFESRVQVFKERNFTKRDVNKSAKHVKPTM